MRRSDVGVAPLLEVVVVVGLLVLPVVGIVALMQDAPLHNRIQAEMEGKVRDQSQYGVVALASFEESLDRTGCPLANELIARALSGEPRNLERTLGLLLPHTSVFNAYVRMGPSEQIVVRQGAPPGAAVSAVATTSACWRPLLAAPDLDKILFSPGGTATAQVGILAAPLWDGDAAWPLGAKLVATVEGKQAWEPGTFNTIPPLASPTIPYKLNTAGVTYRSPRANPPSVVLSIECEHEAFNPTPPPLTTISTGPCGAAVLDPDSLERPRLPSSPYLGPPPGHVQFLNVTVTNHGPGDLPAGSMLFIEAPPGVEFKVHDRSAWLDVRILEGWQEPPEIRVTLKDNLTAAPGQNSRNLSLKVNVTDTRYGVFPVTAHLVGGSTAQSTFLLVPKTPPSQPLGEFRQAVITLPRPLRTDALVPVRVTLQNPLGLSTVEKIWIEAEWATFAEVDDYTAVGTECSWTGVACPIDVSRSADGRRITVTLNGAPSVGGVTAPKTLDVWFRVRALEDAPLGAPGTMVPDLRVYSPCDCYAYDGSWQAATATGLGTHLVLEPPRINGTTPTTWQQGLLDANGWGLDPDDGVVPLELQHGFRKRTSVNITTVRALQLTDLTGFLTLAGFRDALQAAHVNVTPDPATQGENVAFHVDAERLLGFLQQFGATDLQVRIDAYGPWGKAPVHTMQEVFTVNSGLLTRQINWTLPLWLPPARYYAVTSFSWHLPSGILPTDYAAGVDDVVTGRVMTSFLIDPDGDRNTPNPIPMDILLLTWDVAWTS